MVNVDGDETAVIEPNARIRGEILSSPLSESEASLVFAVLVELPDRITRTAGAFHTDFGFVGCAKDVNVDVVPHTQLQRILRCLQHCVVMLAAQWTRLLGSDAGNGGVVGGLLDSRPGAMISS